MRQRSLSARSRRTSATITGPMAGPIRPMRVVSSTGAERSSAIVLAGGEARTSTAERQQCPSTLEDQHQSAIECAGQHGVGAGRPRSFSPGDAIQQPVTVVAAHFSGAFTIRLGGFDTTPDLAYAWTMWETPTGATRAVHRDRCPQRERLRRPDHLHRSGAGPDAHRNGITYKLVMEAFSSTNGTCPAVQPSDTRTSSSPAKGPTASPACMRRSCRCARDHREADRGPARDHLTDHGLHLRRHERDRGPPGTTTTSP